MGRLGVHGKTGHLNAMGFQYLSRLHDTACKKRRKGKKDSDGLRRMPKRERNEEKEKQECVQNDELTLRQIK